MFSKKNAFFTNSIYIMLGNISTAGFGLLFWILAGKLFTVEEVGVATGILSSLSTLIVISRLGMDFSIIRFFPNYDKNVLLGTAITLTTFFALVLGIIYLFVIDSITPELYIIKSSSNFVIFLIVLALNSITTLTGVAFIALRKAGFQFIQKLTIGFRLLFLIFFIEYGSIGIFKSVGLAFLVSFIVALFLLNRLGLGIKPSFDIAFLKNTAYFSFGNYLNGLFVTLPNMILPIIVLSVLGAEQAAYYYISYSIASVVYMIPNSTSTSLFVEGSHGKSLLRNSINSIMINFVIVIPILIFIYLFGHQLLNLVGNNYASNGLSLLKLMLIATFFVTIYSTYVAILRVKNKVNNIIFFSVVNFLLLMSLSYILMNRMGLIGIGYSWFFSYAISTVLILIVEAQKKLAKY